MSHRRNASWNEEPLMVPSSVEEFVAKFGGNNAHVIKKVDALLC